MSMRIWIGSGRRLRAALVAYGTALLGLIAISPAASAVSLAVDLDPATASVEATRSIAVGESLMFAITIALVTADEPLNAFELDLAFDGTVVEALSALVGSFLAAPTDVAELSLAPPQLGLAFFTLGPGANSGSGVLALVTMRGLAPGTSALTLNDVILSAPFGEEIFVDALSGAQLQVLVPEPGTVLLLALGAGALACRKNW